MMRTTEKVRLVPGAMLLTGVLYALVGAPGFVSELSRTVLELLLREAFRNRPVWLLVTHIVILRVLRQTWYRRALPSPAT